MYGPTVQELGAPFPPDSTVHETDEYDDHEPESYVPLPEVARRPYLTYALLVVNAAVFGLAHLAGGTQDPDVLLDFGAMFGPYVSEGEYWRLFTAMFLHSGYVHLAFNVLGLFIFGQTVERAYGHARFFLVYFLAGLAGGVTSYLFNSIAIAAGASGAIFGIVGALAAFFLLQRKTFGKHAQNNLIAVAIIVAINIFIGLSIPGIDNWAHAGGLVAGFVLGLALSPQYRTARTVLGRPVIINTTGSIVLKWWVVPAALLILALGVTLAGRRMPENAFTHYFSAERYYSQGNYDRALDELALSIGSDMTPPEAHLLRGKIHVEAGNYQLARRDLTVALRSGDPDVRARALESIRAMPDR